MNAYRDYVEQEMNNRSWRQSDLVRASGLSRAVVSRILSDSRDVLNQKPDESTINGLAKAFGVQRSKILAVIGEAMEFPMTVTVGGLTDATTNELLAELKSRTSDDQKIEQRVTKVAARGELTPEAMKAVEELVLKIVQRESRE